MTQHTLLLSLSFCFHFFVLDLFYFCNSKYRPVVRIARSLLLTAARYFAEVFLRIFMQLFLFVLVKIFILRLGSDQMRYACQIDTFCAQRVQNEKSAYTYFFLDTSRLGVGWGSDGDLI